MRFRLTLLAVLFAATAGSAAYSAERCRVTDPTGTPLNVRNFRGEIIDTVVNDRIVMVRRYGEDEHHKPWALIDTPDGEPIGWVYREFISCF
jgi:hypothetical protein